jgi:DNA repair exonuclease SbcCD ATPase subunit
MDRGSELATGIQSYTTVKDGYVQLLRSAAYKTGTERTDALNALENQNRRLQDAVRTLLQMWQSGNAELDEFSKYTLDGLRQDLEKYKKELSELQNGRDELTKLQRIYGTAQTDLTTQRYTYFAYIIAVLILLIIDFILFVVLSFQYESPSFIPGVSELMGPATE